MIKKLLPRKGKLSKTEFVLRLALVLAFAFAFSVTLVPAPDHAVHAQACTDDDGDGYDDTDTTRPCLALDTSGLMGSIFSWANMIIPVLIPLAAIGIGLMFGSQIVGGLKSFFSGFRIMG